MASGLVALIVPGDIVTCEDNNTFNLKIEFKSDRMKAIHC